MTRPSVATTRPRDTGQQWMVPGSLTSVSAAPELFGRHPGYEPLLGWIEEFVTRPHPALGRAGAVCPRMAPALNADRVWLMVLRPPAFTAAAASACGQLLHGVFTGLFADPFASQQAAGQAGSPGSGVEQFEQPGGFLQSGALLAVIEDLPPRQAGEFIDGGHRLMRPSFVREGLMLGEFHPESVVGSVHNRDLLVMRSPVPMFAVRALTRHDLLFLDQPATPAAERVQYLQSYDRFLGADLPPEARADLAARMAAAHHDLEKAGSR